jgi:hypothetical protein
MNIKHNEVFRNLSTISWTPAEQISFPYQARYVDDKLEAILK